MTIKNQLNFFIFAATKFSAGDKDRKKKEDEVLVLLVEIVLHTINAGLTTMWRVGG